MISDWREAIIDVAYIAAAILFIFGLKQLGHPSTARRGNQIAAVGMAAAVLATLITPGIHNHLWIILGIVIGAAISTYFARVVKMTQMPQMVAIFNGMGGATAALVSIVEFSQADRVLPGGEVVSIVLGTIIGSISFTGSLIAFAKLQELMSGRPIVYPSQQIINALVGAGVLALAVLVVVLSGQGIAKPLLVLMFVATLALGALVVLPIGGADMPVVIAILNSLTGIAAALTGFVLNNQALVIANIGVLLESTPRRRQI